jgi:hypothetical protein
MVGDVVGWWWLFIASKSAAATATLAFFSLTIIGLAPSALILLVGIAIDLSLYCGLEQQDC